MLALLLACAPEEESEGRNREPGREEGDSGDAPAAELPASDEVIAAVQADGGRAMLRYATSDGWPVQTSEGFLFATVGRGTWSVAGDFDGWVGQAMDCVDDVCTLVVEGADLQGGYKFTDGSTWNADAWSRRYLYDENGEMSVVQTEDAHLQRHFDVGDDDNVGRTVRVWVPRGEVTHLLYAEDGQNLWDPDAMWGGWRLDESTPAGMMVVGIDNTGDRMEEYTHVSDHYGGVLYGGAGDAYADFLQTTVRALVRKTYGEPETIGVLGSSLGGLISLHIAQRHAGEYDFAACMSGTLGWGSLEDNNETMIERYEGAGHGSTAIYLDSGGSGDTCRDGDGDGIDDDDPTSSDNYCETMQMRTVLENAGYAYDTDLWHWWEPDAEHDEQAWAARVDRPLEIFAGL